MPFWRPLVCQRCPSLFEKYVVRSDSLLSHAWPSWTWRGKPPTHSCLHSDNHCTYIHQESFQLHFFRRQRPSGIMEGWSAFRLPDFPSFLWLSIKHINWEKNEITVTLMISRALFLIEGSSELKHCTMYCLYCEIYFLSLFSSTSFKISSPKYFTNN